MLLVNAMCPCSACKWRDLRTCSAVQAFDHQVSGVDAGFIGAQAHACAQTSHATVAPHDLTRSSRAAIVTVKPCEHGAFPTSGCCDSQRHVRPGCLFHCVRAKIAQLIHTLVSESMQEPSCHLTTVHLPLPAVLCSRGISYDREHETSGLRAAAASKQPNVCSACCEH